MSGPGFLLKVLLKATRFKHTNTFLDKKYEISKDILYW